MYAACTQGCVSSTFGASDTTQIKDLACYQYLGKFNSVPGHHVFNRLALSQTLILFHSIQNSNSGLPKFAHHKDSFRCDHRETVLMAGIIHGASGRRLAFHRSEPSGRMMKSPVSSLKALNAPSSAATISRISAPFLMSQDDLIRLAIVADTFLRFYLPNHSGDV
jgi:hypothetical protein